MSNHSRTDASRGHEPLHPLRGTSVAKRHSTAFEAVENAAKVGRSVTGVEAMPVVAVGHVGFVLRSPLGGRMLSEAELCTLAELPADAGTIRGAICVAGPPAHSLGEMFLQDLPSAAGAIWRAVVNIPEPGMSMGVVLENDGRSILFEHVQREISVTSVDTTGHVMSRRRYDPFALIDGVIVACERFEQRLRTLKLAASWRTMHRQYTRPSFPRVVSEDDDVG